MTPISEVLVDLLWRYTGGCPGGGIHCGNTGASHQDHYLLNACVTCSKIRKTDLIVDL